jgi:hypothetical protein
MPLSLGIEDTSFDRLAILIKREQFDLQPDGEGLDERPYRTTGIQLTPISPVLGIN